MTASNPVAPNERCSVPEWNVCLDHPLTYLGAIDEQGWPRHAWICEDELHGGLPPVYYTRDGSGKFMAAHGADRTIGLLLERARRAEACVDDSLAPYGGGRY